MPSTHEHTLIDGGRYGVSIVAVIEYGIEPASGDGWNEPREEAHPYIINVSLEEVTTTRRFTGTHDESGNPICVYSEKREALPWPGDDVPAWVYRVLDDQEWWDAIDCDEGPCPDHAFDSARDRQLVEGGF